MRRADGHRAVIAGRRTYEHASRWQGDHHDGVPAFVLTHDVPDDPRPGSVRYVTDVHACAARARAEAGDADVMVQSAQTARRAWRRYRYRWRDCLAATGLVGMRSSLW